MRLVQDSNAPAAPTITFDQFLAVDIRIGTVIAAEPYPEAKKPALKLRIDFGSGIGIKQSSAQITRHYDCAALVGRQVAAVVNFAPRQIGKFMSEVLTLGFPDVAGEVVCAGHQSAERRAAVLSDRASPSSPSCRRRSGIRTGVITTVPHFGWIPVFAGMAKRRTLARDPRPSTRRWRALGRG
jgi:tRNA-binding protein